MTYKKEESHIGCSQAFFFPIHAKRMSCSSTMIQFFSTQYNYLIQNSCPECYSYEKDFKSLELSKARCTCGAIGCFKIHGHYDRFVCFSIAVCIIISVIRVRCTSCERTHAVLPDFIIPRRSYANPVVCNVVSNFFNTEPTFPQLLEIAEEKDLHVEYISYLHKFFKKYHEIRIEVFKASYEDTILASHEFNRDYFKEFHYMFMQAILVENQTFFSSS